MSSSSSSSDSSFLASSFLASAAGAAPPAAAPPAAGPAAPTPEPILVIRSFRSQLSRACICSVRRPSRVILSNLGEESGPVGLEVDSGSLEDGGDLLGGDGDVVIGEDEGGVHAGELGRHGGVRKFPRDLAQREQGTRINSENNVNGFTSAGIVGDI